MYFECNSNVNKLYNVVYKINILHIVIVIKQKNYEVSNMECMCQS